MFIFRDEYILYVITQIILTICNVIIIILRPKNSINIMRVKLLKDVNSNNNNNSKQQKTRWFLSTTGRGACCHSSDHMSTHDLTAPPCV